MKKMVCLLISMFCICVFGLSNVLAAEAVKIGNPGLVQYPNNNTKSCLARSVWDLRNYNDRIYVGTGDLNYNQGPVNVWSFDAQGTFMNEYTVDDEQIVVIRSYDNKLFIPGSDARESWDFGNLYVKDNDEWKKFRTIPNGVHVWDIAMFEGKFYVPIRTVPGTEILESSDLLSWKLIGKLSWGTTLFIRAVPLDDFLLIVGITFQGKPSIYKYSMAGGLEEIVISPQSGIWLNFAKPTPYRDGVLFVGNYTWTKLSRPAPLLFLNDFVNGTPLLIEEFQEQNVRDIVVRDGDVYVLTASIKNDTFEGGIWFSHDLQTWVILAEFSVPALPYSLELLDGIFYVGLGNRYYLQGYADAESGSIYRVEPDEPIVILRAVFSPSKWNVEWENSKGTVEAIIDYEIGEWVIDISDIDMSTIQLNNKDIASKVQKIPSFKNEFKECLNKNEFKKLSECFNKKRLKKLSTCLSENEFKKLKKCLNKRNQVLRLEFKKADTLRALGNVSVGDILKVTVSDNFKSGGGFRAEGQVEIIGPTPPSPPPSPPPSTGVPIPLDPINQSDDIIQIDEPPFIPFTLSTPET